MSGCGCKGKSLDSYIEDSEGNGNKTKISILSYIGKVILFLLVLVALPIINLFIIGFIFNTIVLNKEVKLKPLLSALGNKFKEKQEEDTYEDIKDLTNDDVVMLDVEDMTNKK